MYDPYNSLVPIFRETTVPKGIKQVATAVYVKNQMGEFLYTAAHVTDDLAHSKLLVPLDGILTEIEGYIAFIDLPPEYHRNDDTIDIAYVKLSNEFSTVLSRGFEPISGQNKLILENTNNLYTCSVAGYPASRSKKKSGIFSVEIFAFTGMNVSKDVYEKHGLSVSENIAIHFDRKNAVHPEKETISLASGLTGVSGGGIFAWPESKPFDCDWSERKLVGIFHTYKEKEKLMIGSTMLSFLSALTLGNMKGFGGI